MKKWLALIAAAAALFTYHRYSPQPAPAASKAVAKVPVLEEPAPPAPEVNRSPASAPSRVPQNQNAAVELESLEKLSRALAQAGEPAATLNGLLEELQRTRQEPHVIRDQNPDTGEMLIVRTKSPLPGTRYFHAQYFTNDGGERFVQHMSFEFKPGPESMASAVAMVEKTFPGLSRPKVQRDDYVKWTLKDDYIVWVKRMGPADLQDDPFNSYTLKDDGTVRVAVELEIHGD